MGDALLVISISVFGSLFVLWLACSYFEIVGDALLFIIIIVFGALFMSWLAHSYLQYTEGPMYKQESVNKAPIFTGKTPNCKCITVDEARSR
jgi:uncharacterized SAM-binding protein YcdF (DUF218 family)